MQFRKHSDLCDCGTLSWITLLNVIVSGWPRFGSVRLRFGDGTVRAVPVLGSGGSSKEGVFLVFQHSLAEGPVPVPVLVPGKRFRRFQFRIRFLGKRFRRFRFPVPVRILGHPVAFKKKYKYLRDRLALRGLSVDDNGMVPVPDAQIFHGKRGLRTVS